MRDLATYEAEKSVLGAILIDEKSIVRAANIIQPEDFGELRHQIIYSVLLELFFNKTGIDLVTAANALEMKGRLKEVGGASYLSSMANEAISSSLIERHCKIIRNKARRRRAILATQILLQQLEDENKDVKKVIEGSVDSFSKLIQEKKSQSGEITGILNNVISDWDRVEKEGLGLATGLGPIDETIAGFRPGHYWVIMAYTSYGKTAFSVMLLNKFLNLHKNECVVFFSAEMTQKDIASKLIAQRCNRDFYDLISHNDEEDVIRAVSEIQESKVFIYDDCLTPIQMKTRIRLLRMRGYNPKLVFVDYLQNLYADGKEYEKMTKLTTEVQRMSIEEDVCVVALSQIPDDAAKERNHLIKAKGSGAIGATAGFVMEIVRDPEYEAANPHQDVFPVTILIKKNRYGKSKRSFTVYFDSSTGLYHDKETYPNLKADSLDNLFN